MKKTIKISIIISIALVFSVLCGLLVTGASIGWGPFSFIYWPMEVSRVKRENPYKDHQNEIVFYGASNFRLWKEMKEDLSPYNVANCGFGGSTDRMLIDNADELLYPYNPSILFLQTGSNDYPSLEGSVEEKADKVLSTKKEMYQLFHDKLPDAHVFVMAGILMPGRDSFTPIVKLVNQGLREYCSEYSYITFLDSESLTYKDGKYIEEYFINDGIHLTHEARLIWANEYIIPAIKSIKG